MALSELDEYERKKILEVLERDMRLQREEEMRLSNIKHELYCMRQRSALRNSSNTGLLSRFMTCARCRDHFITLAPSDCCRNCRQRTCKNCRIYLNDDKWSCKLCEVNRVYLAASGDWLIRVNLGYSSTGTVSSKLYNQLVSSIRKRNRNRMTESSPSVNVDSGKLIYQQRSGVNDRPPKSKTRRFFRNSVTSESSSTKQPSSPRKYKSEMDLMNEANMAHVNLHDVNCDLEEENNEMSASVKASWTGSSNSQVFQSSGEEFGRNRADTGMPKTKSACDLLTFNDGSNNGSSTHLSVGQRTSLSSSVGGKLDLEKCNSSNLEVPGRRTNSRTVSSSTSLGPASSRSSITSIGSFYEGNLDPTSMQGEVVLALYYNFRQGNLEIHISHCTDLSFQAYGPVTKPNPYIKTYLLPLPQKRVHKLKKKTRTKKHTTDPKFSEVLKYPGFTKSELESRQLYVGVWHSDLLGKNLLLGETTISLADYPWGSSSKELHTFSLYTRLPDDPTPTLVDQQLTVIESNSPTDLVPETVNMTRVVQMVAELHLSVKFMPPEANHQTHGELHCLVSSIGAMRHKDIAVYLKGRLMDGISNKVVKQRTKAVHATGDMMLNHTFVFTDQTLQGIRAKALTFFLIQQQSLSHKTLASATMGFIENTPQGGFLDDGVWAEMIERPNTWIVRTIPLLEIHKS